MLQRFKNIAILLLLLLIGVKDFVEVYVFLTAEEISVSAKRLEFRSPGSYNDITIPFLPDQIDNREGEEDEFGENEEAIYYDTNQPAFIDAKVLVSNDLNSNRHVLYPYKYLLYCSLKLDC